MSRRTIRDNLKTVIETGLVGVLNEVSIGRRDRLPVEKLPAAVIYTGSESIEPVTINQPRELLRTLDLSVQIFVREGMDFSWDDLSTWLDGNTFFTGGGDLVDDHLDALAYVIEDAVAASNDLGIAWVNDIVPSSWTVEGIEEDTDARYLVGTITFACTYFSTEAV